MENTASYSAYSTDIYASKSARIKAFLMDFVILLTLSFTVGILISLIVAGFSLSGVRLGWIMFFTFIFYPILSLAYYIYYECSAKQATIGKQALDLKVVDADGNRLTIGAAIIRNLVKFVLTIGVVTIFFDSKKQALHDMLAKTSVVKNY